VYGGINTYFFKKSCHFFKPPLKKIHFSLILFLIFSPILVRFLEHAGYYFTAQIFAYIGYMWMGFVFVFCCIFFSFDFLQWCVKLIKKTFFLSKRNIFIISCSLSVFIVIYGYFEALNIKVEKVIIKTQKIPKSMGSIRIVQISDVHLGVLVREERLKKIVKIIQELKPDILVSTGDLVDAVIDGKEKYVKFLRELDPKYGKYAVTGNHEFFAGIEESVQFTQKSGFEVLRGEGIDIDGFLSIAGVDDSAGKMYGVKSKITEKELADKFAREKFSILLKHRPVMEENTGLCFDLQLSGHTHKGQIFPFNFLIALFYPHYAGLWDNGNGSYLYVSRGTGTWGPLMRFLAVPEVTLIEIIPV
jgi:predicted MPP superfamily phosphohydrolase